MTTPKSPWSCPAECDHGTIHSANAAGTMGEDVACQECDGAGVLDEIECELCGMILARTIDPVILTGDGWACVECAGKES